jgi:hypothetical protein
MPDSASPLPTSIPPKQSGIERRAHVRYVRNLAAFCHLLTTESKDAWCQGAVRDISVSGLGLVIPYAVLPGKLLAVQLEGVSRRLLARVAHATRQPGGGAWIVGCELISQLRKEELQVLLQEAP